MVDAQLQKLLICPRCHGELEFQDRRILCHDCGTRYPVEGRIPVMITEVSNDGFGHDLCHAQLNGNLFEKVFHTNRIETLLRLITSELDIAPGTRALDVGCNTGPLLIPLRQRGYDVVGIDISLDEVQKAERYLHQHRLPRDKLSVADGTRLPFRDQSFDCMLLVDILEHTGHPERVVFEAKRLLVPGGVVIVTVPWASHPYVRHTWLRKALSSRKTIDEHPDAPFKLRMLQDLFLTGAASGKPTFEPVLFRLVFHWVCILGVYRLTQVEPAAALVTPETPLAETHSPQVPSTPAPVKGSVSP